MAQDFEFDVFVSYSRKDEAVVLELAQRLRSEGVRVWRGWSAKWGQVSILFT